MYVKILIFAVIFWSIPEDNCLVIKLGKFDFKYNLTTSGIKIEVVNGAKQILTGSLFNSNDVTKAKCDDNLNCDFGSYKLNVTKVEDGLHLVWESRDLTRVFEDCFDFGKAHWYGGPQRGIQRWPIERLQVNGSEPYTINEDFPVAKRYWLNSNGAYIFVEDKVPLFIEQNVHIQEAVCFNARLEAPYINRTRNILEYYLVFKDDPKQAHLDAVNKHLGKHSTWGDNTGLYTVITTLLQLNMNGYALVLPDYIGGNGYKGVMQNAELLVRWTQVNTFMPTMQFSYLPWDYTSDEFDAEAIVKKFIDLRANISSKIMEAIDGSIKDGIPVNAPIWWIDPTDSKALACDDEFLLGEDILVAPVIVEKARSRDVYLPKGNWVDGNNGTTYKGPVLLKNYPAPIELLPYFYSSSSHSSYSLSSSSSSCYCYPTSCSSSSSSFPSTCSCTSAACSSNASSSSSSSYCYCSSASCSTTVSSSRPSSSSCSCSPSTCSSSKMQKYGYSL